MTFNKIDEAIDNVKKAMYQQVGDKELSNSFNAVKVITDVAKEMLAEVANDPMLSPQGVAQKERELKDEFADEIKSVIDDFEKKKTLELEKAERLAKELIARPSVEPTDVDKAQFQRRYNDLKTQLTVFGSENAARKMIEFMSGLEEPYYADVVLSEFAEIGQHLKASIDNIRLMSTYEQVKKTADSAGKAVAERKLAEIKQLQQAPAIDTLTIGLLIKQTLGDDYADRILRR